MPDEVTVLPEAERLVLRDTMVASIKDYLEAELATGKNPYVLLAEMSAVLQEAFAE